MKPIKMRLGGRSTTKDDLVQVINAITGTVHRFPGFHVNQLRGILERYFNAECIRVQRLESRLVEVTGTSASLVNLNRPFLEHYNKTEKALRDRIALLENRLERACGSREKYEQILKEEQ